jgi:hypothetical protein
MAKGEWQMANGKRQTANGKRSVDCTNTVNQFYLTRKDARSAAAVSARDSHATRSPTLE